MICRRYASRIPVTDMTRITSPATQPAVRWTQNKNLRGVIGRLSRSNFRPAPQQVVIDASELHYRGIVGRGGIQPLDGGVEIEEQCPLPVVPHHALDPEE